MTERFGELVQLLTSLLNSDKYRKSGYNGVFNKKRIVFTSGHLKRRIEIKNNLTIDHVYQILLGSDDLADSQGFRIVSIRDIALITDVEIQSPLKSITFYVHIEPKFTPNKQDKVDIGKEDLLGALVMFFGFNMIALDGDAVSWDLPKGKVSVIKFLECDGVPSVLIGWDSNKNFQGLAHIDLVKGLDHVKQYGQHVLKRIGRDGDMDSHLNFESGL